MARRTTSEARSEVLNLRVTPTERATLQSAADRTGSPSLGDYVRVAALTTATSTPDDVVAAAQYLNHTIPAMEAALNQAKAILEGKGEA